MPHSYLANLSHQRGSEAPVSMRAMIANTMWMIKKIIIATSTDDSKVVAAESS